MPFYPDEPYELPDGRLVCGSHGLVICGKCCVDYSFMDEINGEDEGGYEDDEEVFDLGDRPNPFHLMLSPEARVDYNLQYERPPYRERVVANTASYGYASSSRASAGRAPPPRVNYDADKKHRGTGRVFPTVFTPPSNTIRPFELFPPTPVGSIYDQPARFVHRGDGRKMLITTDGACLNNGKSNPRAGWAFVCGPPPIGQTTPYTTSARLENYGPWDAPAIQSNNRAELRAVIAALRFRHWSGEGFNTVVIATDSEYVTLGSTDWARKWYFNGWRTTSGAKVKNHDLWEMLLGEIEQWHDKGVSIQFWRIPREWNTDADAGAKQAAESDRPLERWQDICGTIAW
ncbi:putative ribonuclease H1 [Xylaria sp. CBS 124048]|nr:putative ribonuclease H1 [Xylaria sp. CBS 124048]